MLSWRKADKETVAAHCELLRVVMKLPCKPVGGYNCVTQSLKGHDFNNISTHQCGITL